MLSTLDNRQHDQRDVLEISPDVVLVARAAADFPSLAPDAMGRHAERDIHMGSPDVATPMVDTTFRAADTSGERPLRARWVRTVAMTFLFALGSAFAAAAWERYGDEAQAMLSSYTPSLSIPLSLPTSLTSLVSGRPASAAQTDSAAAPEPVAAEQTAQAAPAVIPADASAPGVPADTAQLLQSMARDVASLNQQLSELKARIAELKAGQDLLTRDVAKTPEAKVSEAKPVEPRPTKLGAPPRPLGTLVTPAPVHRPRPPAYPPAQAAYVPPPPPAATPVQIAPPPPVNNTDPVPVVRPPMPVQQ
jgi:hypothetical protein